MRQITLHNITSVTTMQTIAWGDIGKRELITGKVGVCGKFGIGYRQHDFSIHQLQGNSIMVIFINWRANQFPEKGYNENLAEIPFCSFSPLIGLRPRCRTF